jgi:hypothetical protein
MSEHCNTCTAARLHGCTVGVVGVVAVVGVVG